MSPRRRPLLTYDGGCGFCRRWVLRWEVSVGERVEFRPYQELDESEVGLPATELARAVHFFDEGGAVHRGAEAVLLALARAPGKGWMLALYRRVPGWSWVAERFYGLVARHRTAASVAVRWTVGPDLAPPRYALVRRLFLAALGAVYLIAFLSLGVQVTGLFGAEGVLPLTERLERARAHVSSWDAPSILWLGSGDAALTGTCAAGAVLALMVCAGLAPRASLALLWAGYLSLVSVGEPFLSFQWDALLLETGLLAVFLAPGGLRPDWSREPPRSALWLLRWLLFRLVFMSGCVKLSSGDPVWRDLTALEFHHWTQPLPHRLAWFVHHLPAWAHRAAAAATFAIELGAPWLLFGPRRLRVAAVGAIVVLMVAINATGNYGFFTPLTIALCLCALDDGLVRRWFRSTGGPMQRAPAGSFRRAVAALLVLGVLGLTGGDLLRRLELVERLPGPLAALDRRAAPFRSFNTYGLFAVMTTERPEILVEGSPDGEAWRPYAFHWKPGALERPPGFAGPHMPRLDWQMWFAALGDWRSTPWYTELVRSLLEGRADARALFSVDPFPEAPPRFVRSTLYRYRFTTPDERRAGGAWWAREAPLPYAPTFTLDARGELSAVR